MSKLSDLANAISASSPKIKAFCQEAAVEIDALAAQMTIARNDLAAIKAHLDVLDAEGQDLDARLDKLEGGTTPPPPPPPSSLVHYKGLDAYRVGDLNIMASLGVKHVRTDYWNATDVNFVNTLRANGMKATSVIGYGTWRANPSGTGGTDKYPPTDLAAWTAAHLGVLNNLDVIEAVEVWNEPWLATGDLNTGAFWLPKSDAVAYYNLVKTYAVEAWKKAPNIPVLVSLDYWTQGSLNTRWNWQNAVIAADVTGLLKDPRIRPSVHCYTEKDDPDNPRTLGWAFDRYTLAYDALKAHGHPNPQAWVTEYGWQSDVVGEQNQADYTVRAIKKMAASGKVERAHCFMLKSNDPWTYNWLTPTNGQKLVCQAVKALA